MMLRAFSQEGLDVLERARERFAKFPVTTPLFLAEDAAGNSVSAREPSACRWCVYGALLKETSGAEVLPVEEGGSLSMRLSFLLNGADNSIDVVGAFTARQITHAQALAAFDRTIEEAKAYLAAFVAEDGKDKR